MSLSGFDAALHQWLGRDQAQVEAFERKALCDLLTGSQRDSSGLKAAAERHGVLGLLPPDGADWVQAVRGAQTRALRALRFTVRTIAALEAAGIECVVLKGVAIAARWTEPTARQQSDLDVLVSPNDLRAASKVLLDAGIAGNEFLAGKHVHNASLEPKEKGGLLIELHHALNSNHEIAVDVPTLLARRIRVATPQGDLPALSAEDDAAYLAMHAATHVVARLAWLVDLAALHRAGVDWVEAARRARDWNIALPVECAWRQARELLAVPIPERAFAELGTSGAQRLAIEALLRATGATGGTPNFWFQRAFRLALVRPRDWPQLTVHKWQARREEQQAYGYDLFKSIIGSWV